MNPAARAFTLVEMLVAMALTAIMLGLLALLFTNINGVVGHVADTTRAYDDIRPGIQSMGRELASTLLRTEARRWLNFRVVESTGPRGRRVAVYATVPDEALGSTLEMSFINHVVYYWDEADHALHRVAHNTRDDNRLLLATAADPDNLDADANLSRLGHMTLAYRHPTPYGWTTDPLLTARMNQPPELAIVRDVHHFEVACYETPPTDGDAPATTWNRADALPLLVELRLGLAHGADAERVEHILATTGDIQQARKHMQRFTYAFPMANHSTQNAAGP